MQWWLLDCRAQCRLHAQRTVGVWVGGVMHSASAQSPESGGVHATASLQELWSERPGARPLLFV